MPVLIGWAAVTGSLDWAAVHPVRRHLPLDAAALLAAVDEVPRRLQGGAACRCSPSCAAARRSGCRSSCTPGRWSRARCCSSRSRTWALLYTAVALVAGGWFLYESHRLYNLAIRHASVVADAGVPRLDRLPDADLPRRRDRSAAAVLSAMTAALRTERLRSGCAARVGHRRRVRRVPGRRSAALDPDPVPVHAARTPSSSSAATCRTARRADVLGLGVPARRRAADRDRGGAQGRGGRLGVARMLAGAGGARDTATCGRRSRASWRTPSTRRAGLHPAALGVPGRQRGEQAPRASRRFRVRSGERTRCVLPRREAHRRRRASAPRRAPASATRRVAARCRRRRRSGACATGAVSASTTAVIAAASIAASIMWMPTRIPGQAGVRLDEADRDLTSSTTRRIAREATHGLVPNAQDATRG